MVEFSADQISRLSTTPVARMATADTAGRPQVIPVCFVYDGGCIYSVLDAKPKRAALTGLRRVRNILANPQVSLVLDHYDDDWAQLWYLLVTGRAELIEGTDESESAIASLREKYPQYRRMELTGNPVIKITPERVTGWSGS